MKVAGSVSGQARLGGRRGLRSDGLHQPAVALALLGRHIRRHLIGGGDCPGGNFRLHGARFDHDHLDAEWGDFAPRGVTDRFECKLRARVRTIDRWPWRPCHPRS
jgi:hypothetical protein